jgi:hypothetical protein
MGVKRIKSQFGRADRVMSKFKINFPQNLRTLIVLSYLTF